MVTSFALGGRHSGTGKNAYFVSCQAMFGSCVRDCDGQVLLNLDACANRSPWRGNFASEGYLKRVLIILKKTCIVTPEKCRKLCIIPACYTGCFAELTESIYTDFPEDFFRRKTFFILKELISKIVVRTILLGFPKHYKAAGTCITKLSQFKHEIFISTGSVFSAAAPISRGTELSPTLECQKVLGYG
jgi:hypothetical protein